ncbi:DUF6123 family protein [Calidifontibacillus oryziterrae]|uniref:DUF6123 family protein n=1 Tax=Calidifontibacillus oryziterrae TaxID=1191699 RepID=UPI0003200D0A|nr:DUF6123 family protein [Calidifontibacillus oryziterrae]
MAFSTASTEEYLNHLQTKGFYFHEDSLGFIEFGRRYTETSDALVNMAIEVTLKAQLQFDGSFFIAILEMLKENKISSKKEAYKLFRNKKIL